MERAENVKNYQEMCIYYLGNPYLLPKIAYQSDVIG